MVDVMCGGDWTVIFTSSGLIYYCGLDSEEDRYENRQYTPTIHQYFTELKVKYTCVKNLELDYPDSGRHIAFLTASGKWIQKCIYFLFAF